MQHPKVARPQIVDTSVRVDQLRSIAGEREGHRVDREVAACEVLLDGRRAYLREGAGLWVALGSRPGDVDLDPVELEPAGQEESLPLELEARHVGERIDLPLDRHVEVRSVVDSEQQVADRATHQICLHPSGDAAEHVDSRQMVDQLRQPFRVDFT